MTGAKWMYHHESNSMILVDADETVRLKSAPWSKTEQRAVMLAMSRAARQCGGHRQAEPDAARGWQIVHDAPAPMDNATMALRRFAAKMRERLT